MATKHQLSREQMELVIQQGGSVLHYKDGAPVIHTSVATLPTEVELAQGDADAQERARKNLLEQKKQIDAQLALIPGEQKPASTDSSDSGEQEPAKGKK